jgi:hypothetical protein
MREIIALTLLLVSLNTFAQEKDKGPELNCFHKWAVKFEDRGADAVYDGTYDDVIVTIRVGAKATCDKGKAEVKDGKLVRFYLLLSDGSYELVQKTWKAKSNENVTIFNGMSKSMITVHGELINVLWPSKIRAKKAKPQSAPDPTDD